MIKDLLEIYDSSNLNEGNPKCIFAETLIFNEGWLLRGILEKWKGWKSQSKYSFLPFPDGVKIYSEAQLYTPFRKRSRNDKQGETHTHVDGIVGNFYIHPGTKSGVILENDFKYLAVFEAKMYSGIQKKITHIDNYSQVSRTIACIINSVLSVEKNNYYDIHFIVLYPIDNGYKITPIKYSKDFIEREIKERIRIYKNFELITQTNNNFDLFEMQWKAILKNINIQFITWDDILKEINDQEINKFYNLCKNFGK